MAQTSIEWCTHVWNPVTGCDRVSPGCANCYALTYAGRLKGMGQEKYQRDGGRASGPGFGVTLHPDELRAPLGWRKPRRIFVNSMSDLFHEEVPDAFILAVWAAMEAAPQHTYLILTKRAERMRTLMGTERPPAPPQPPYERRPLLGWRGYFADSEGHIWSARRGPLRCLRPDTGEQGHQRVSLFDGARTGPRGHRQLVHELVLETFDRPREPGEQGCHRDGDATNNAISNLYWGTQADNWADRNRHGNGRSWSKLTVADVLEIRTQALRGDSAAGIARGHGISDTQVRNIVSGRQWGFKVLPSVWLGVSIENRRFVGRADVLRETPAAVRFISAEPLLGPLLPFHGWRSPRDKAHGRDPERWWVDGYDGPGLDLAGIDWLIVGGESGHGHRPIRPEWVRDLRDACLSQYAGPCSCGAWPTPADAREGRCRICGSASPELGGHGRTAFFMKQWGGRTPKAGGRELDGRTWDELPRTSRHAEEAIT